MHKKQNLPEKICVQCNRPFAWRKKWERDWEQVKYCSERCRRDHKPSSSGGAIGVKPKGSASAH